MRKYTEQKMLKRKFNCMCWVNQENSCYGLQAQNTPNIPLTVVLHAYSKELEPVQGKVTLLLLYL